MSVSPIHQKYREAFIAALIGLVTNFALGIIKLAAGVISTSSALIADAVNSLGDSLTSLAVLYGLSVAQRPADAEHPYGHSRAEGIAATNVAVLIIVSAAIVGWEALHRFHAAAPLTPWWTLAVAGGNVLLKETLYQYKSRVGRRTGSTAILANAWDHRSDALCSLAVLISLATIRWGGPELAWVDPLAALIVSAGVIWSSIHLFRVSASELMDVQAAPGLLQNVRQTASQVEGVEQIETLLIRKSGLEYLVDIHIEVQSELSVAEGHRISHHVKDRLLHEYQELRHVLVHIEPFPHKHD